MPVIEITSLEHPGVEVFSTLTEAQLRNRIDLQRGIFIAESPKVIRVALEAGYEPVSLLCERKCPCSVSGSILRVMQRTLCSAWRICQFIRATGNCWPGSPVIR